LFGQVKTMGGTRIWRTLEIKFEWKTPSGWPKTKWFNQVLGDIKRRERRSWQEIRKERLWEGTRYFHSVILSCVGSFVVLCVCMWKTNLIINFMILFLLILYSSQTGWWGPQHSSLSDKWSTGFQHHRLSSWWWILILNMICCIDTMPKRIKTSHLNSSTKPHIVVS
jgi:hypothetical protein